MVGTASLILATLSDWPRLAAPSYSLWIIALVLFGTLGLIDDWLGDSRARGIRGHLRALVQERRITTGLVKAVGGLAAALWIARQFVPPSAAVWVLNSLLIALSANVINLLDVRPGRATAAFIGMACFTGVAVWLLCPTQLGRLLPLAVLAVPALLEWFYDRKALLMLGDVGSNSLGAAIGIGFLTLPVSVRIAAVLVLLTVHVLAERYSLSALIDRYSALRRLDELTGVRLSRANAPAADSER